MFTVNQICQALEVPSIDQAVLYHVQNFQNEYAKTGALPVKKQITNSADRKYNSAVSAFLILAGV